MRWHQAKNSFSSLNGCVFAISMDTRKILEVEPLKQSHDYKMSITSAIRNTFGWFFQWYHNEMDSKYSKFLKCEWKTTCEIALESVKKKR